MSHQSSDPLTAPPGFDRVAFDLLRDRARVVAAPAGTVVFRPGEPCQSLVLLTQGTVRVRMVSESGREIQLYRVLPGEACVMSVACLLENRIYQAEGICETDITGQAISAALFRELLAVSSSFRESVLATQTRRIYDLIGLVDVVAFHRTEARLAARLLERAGAGDVVAETHSELALDLGTAREVVSRRLKRLEMEGAVALERGRIRILDRVRLRQMCVD